MNWTRTLTCTLRVLGAGFVVFFAGALYASAVKITEPAFIYRMLGWGGVGDPTEQMLCVIYIAWGVFLWLAADDPYRNSLFINFTIAANVAHAALMAVQALVVPGELAHLHGDVPMVLLVAVALAVPWLAVRRAEHFISEDGQRP